MSHLYALFGGPEEDEVRVKGQRLAKAWMDKAVDGVEKARKHVGLRLGGKAELDWPRQCHHEGPPMESRPCEIQARTATRRADRVWRKRPRRIKGLCDGLADGADEPREDLEPAESSEGESESSSDSSDSESDTDCFESCDPHSPDSEEDSEPSGTEAKEPAPSEAGPASLGLPESESSETESEDSSASESDSGESDPFDMGSRRRGPLTSSSSDSDSSSTGGPGSSSTDSGIARPSSSDIEVDFTTSSPSLEETEEFGRKVTGLSGWARWQVRKLLAVLTRMRKNLPPSARVEAVRRLGWRLGPGIEACRTIAEGTDPRPAQASEGGDQIRKFLEEWQQKYRESEERYRAERDEAFRSDDEAARAEEQLAAERAAEIKKRTKTIEQQLPLITARLGILWNEVTGSSRPVPSEIRLT